VFFVSGFAALVYQTVWQRSLFAIFGINIESVTVIVTAFMLGLGFGSLAGGWLSSRPNLAPLLLFSLAELGIGAFGLVSLPLFHWVGAHMLPLSAASTGAVALSLLLVPTLLMGATLPLLVEHLVMRSGNVGRSVGLLYFVNTLGSAVAAMMTAIYLLGAFGQQGAVWVAAALNAVVGLAALAGYAAQRRSA
jgi:predicted membrane-bound spermidine synthase